MKKAKEMFKFFTVPIIIIIIVSVAVAVSVILAPSFWFLTINDGQWEDAELGNPSNYTENVSPVDQGGLVVDKDAIIKAGLKGLKLTDDEIENMTDEEIIDKLEINKKLKKDPKVTSLDDVTQAEILWCISDVYSKYLDNPEQLEKLLNAEIITQYPDMGQTDAELNGIIKFERHKNDGTSKFLTYIDSDTFSSYVNSNDEKALDYFTLDEQGNAVVAYLNVTTETLTFNDSDVKISDYTETLTENNKQAEGSYKKVTKTILTITINYKSVVEKYTMPFNYLWSLLVIGEDPGFVLELADLVENSEITISIYDNITTTRDENVYTYKKETRTDKYARLFVRNTYGLTGFATQRYWLAKDSPNADGNYSSRYPASYNTDPTNYIVTHTIITERNDIKYDLTKADVWIYYYSKEYAMPKGEIQPIVNKNSVNQDDTEYVLNSKTSRDSNSDSSLLNDSEAVSFAQSVKEYIEKNATKPKKIINGINGSPPIEIEEDVVADVQVSYVDIKNYDHKIERVQTQTVTTTEQRYVAQTPISRAKDDKNADEDNFVTILCKSTHQKAKDYLTDGTTTEWLWDILEVNAPDMIDLTKYLFYRATGHNFGVTSYDFSEYEKTDFISIGTIGGSLSLTTPVLSREDFIAAMKAYSNKINGKKKTNFDTNFLPYAGDIYDWSCEYGVNPELVVITAATEQSFYAGGGSYNYWGISVTNGSSRGSSFSSLKDGIRGYAEVIKSYQTGSKAELIRVRAAERQAAGVDPTGYGTPDTLSGMQSIYSFLGSHVEGSAGAGGYYYMDPARAGVTKIYKTHEEFLSLCRNSGKAEHAQGTITTVWEQGQYTAWQVEQKLDVWNYIFGDYGSLYNGNSEIIEIAKSKLGCPYVYGAKGPNSFDCSGLVNWVYKQIGIEVPGSTAGYKTYINSANEIDWSEAQPGDILIIFGDERGKKDGHAGIYLGNDEYIHAPQTGDVVKISSGASKMFKHVFRFQ